MATRQIKEQNVSKEKVTPWFPGAVKPARKGVYQRDYIDDVRLIDDIRFNYWDGRNWRWPARSAELAADFNEGWLKSGFQSLPWRGLASDPKGGVA